MPIATSFALPRHSQRKTAATAFLAWVAAACVLGAGAATLCANGDCAIPPLDARGLNGLHALQQPALTAFFSAITWLGSIAVLLPAALALSVWLHHSGKRTFALLPPLALAGAWLLAHMAKLATARPRPGLHEALIPIPADSSFPSAHTLQITAFALATVLAAGQCRKWPPVLIAVLAVGSVMLSRLYLQVHFPTDVLFGLMAAAVWTGGLYYAMARRP